MADVKCEGIGSQQPPSDLPFDPTITFNKGQRFTNINPQ